uniref:Uncharacterized protein n=1 Tax=Arundo donax TaxID=35708 RepID=A0A0A8ZS49_ARUDO
MPQGSHCPTLGLLSKSMDKHAPMQTLCMCLHDHPVTHPHPPDSTQAHQADFRNLQLCVSSISGMNCTISTPKSFKQGNCFLKGST